MRLYQFGPEVARQISQHGSDFALTPLVRTAGDVAHTTIQIVCMHLGVGGVVGYHQATTKQLFLVVAGAGWVCGTDRARQPIGPFEAAFWEPGEWHEAGSATGMTALVIEGDAIDPSLLIPR